MTDHKRPKARKKLGIVATVATSVAASIGKAAEAVAAPLKAQAERFEDGGFRQNERQHADKLDEAALAFLANPDKYRAAVFGTSLAAEERKEKRRIMADGIEMLARLCREPKS